MKKKERDEAYVSKARATWTLDTNGVLIPEHPDVQEVHDSGAFVEAWVWVGPLAEEK